MRIFLLGDFKSYNGPGNANRKIRDAIRLKYEVSYSKRTNKLFRIIEMYRQTKHADVLLMCSNSAINRFAIYVAKKYNKKIIYLMHGYSSYETKIENPDLSTRNINRIKEYEDLMFSSADRIVCVSKRAMNYMKQDVPQYAAKFDYIYNVVDLKRIIKTNSIRNKDVIHKQIISVGGGMKQKNINTIANVIDRMNDNMRFIVVGRSMSDGYLIRSHKSVIWKEYLSHDDLLLKMSESYMYIQNSTFETFCLAVIEALLCGCNILVSNKVGCLDLFDDIRQEDIIYDVYDESEIKEKIEYLLNNPNNNRLLNSFKKEFITIEYQSEKWNDIIGNIISKKMD